MFASSFGDLGLGEYKITEHMIAVVIFDKLRVHISPPVHVGWFALLPKFGVATSDINDSTSRSKLSAIAIDGFFAIGDTYRHYQ